VLMKII